MTRISNLLLACVLCLGLVSCAADEAIEEGTDCDETCPVGAQKVAAKSADGTCGADGSFNKSGEVTAAGECSGHGECQVICLFPKCEEGQSLIITATEYKCEGSGDPCSGVDCDGHGDCQVVFDAPECQCEAGYDASGIHCVENTGPAVYTLTPPTAKVGEMATFIVTGENLPMTMAATVDKCDALSFTKRGEAEQEFVCTPSEGGVAARKLYTQPQGDLLYEDEVMFEE